MSFANVGCCFALGLRGQLLCQLCFEFFRRCLAPCFALYLSLLHFAGSFRSDYVQVWKLVSVRVREAHANAFALCCLIEAVACGVRVFENDSIDACSVIEQRHRERQIFICLLTAVIHGK